MQKTVTVLVAVSIMLSLVVAIEAVQIGGLNPLQLGNPTQRVDVNAQALQQNTNVGAMQIYPSEISLANGTSTAVLDAESAMLNHVFNMANGSVVQITAKVKTTVPNIKLNGNPIERESTVLGSGFAYDTEGRIITNNHVVEGADTVDVTFVDGNIYSAKVVATDAFSDLAVLQIDDVLSDEYLFPLTLGDSSQLKVGQQVIAIGNPFGLSDTMTTGIVSQVGRLLPNKEMGFSIPSIIQTDAAINPGNSGGPLLDIHGNVIGVNAAIRSSTGQFSGIGFAIPSNTVARIAPQLIKEGKYDHPWLGISGTNLTPDLADRFGLPRDLKGVVVQNVAPGGPADIAGLAGSNNDNVPAADAITAIDGHAVKRIEDVVFYIEEQTSVGDNIVITVQRDGQSYDLKATLQARPLPTVETN